MEEPFLMNSSAPPHSHRKTWPTLGSAALALLMLAGCAQLPEGAPSGLTNETDATKAPSVAIAVTPSEPAALAPALAPTLAGALASATAAVTPDPIPAALVLASPPTTRSRLDPRADAERGDLWARVRAGYAMPDLEGHLVAKWEQWYGSRPDYVQRMTERGGRYLFHIVEEIERRGMPTDLSLLPFIESAFNPQAISSARASGMWQFMPATGRDFELRQNLFRDDRRAVLASTQAALDYLQRLHVRFGDWHLALAAYNWGQGNVQRAIDRNQRAGLGTGYTDLKMPDETRNYVPKLQAVKNIIARPSSFSLVLPLLEDHPYFLSVPIERDIDVALAASLAGLPLENFQQLNPQMNKPVILAAGTPMVLLPYDNANQFLRGVAAHRGPLASWTAWVAQRNIRPSDAAKIVGMPEARLRDVNRIPPGMLVRKGSTLLVPRSATAEQDVASHIADNAALALTRDAPALRSVSFKARKGETVASVARRYKLSPAQVARWNNVGVKTQFKQGQTLVVMLAPTPGKRSTRAASAGTKRAQATAPVRQARQSKQSKQAQQKQTAPRQGSKTPPVRVARQ